MARHSKKVDPPPRPEPTDGEREHIHSSAEQLRARPVRTSVEWDGVEIAAPHSDTEGNRAALLNAFGTSSESFVGTQLGILEMAWRQRGTKRGQTSTDLNAALALLESINPQNEMEAALGVQMAAIHSLSSELLGRAKQTDNAEHVALYCGQAVKLTRTFATQLETLSKLRGGSKQQVEVRYVYVNGDAIIGDVQHGGGGKTENRHQPHAPCLEASAGASMLGPLAPLGEALSGASDQGQEALPHARR